MAVIFMHSVVRMSVLTEAICLLQTYDELWLFISEMYYVGPIFWQCFMNEATGSTMVTQSQNARNYYHDNKYNLLKDSTLSKNMILSMHSKCCGKFMKLLLEGSEPVHGGYNGWVQESVKHELRMKMTTCFLLPYFYNSYVSSVIFTTWAITYLSLNQTCNKLNHWKILGSKLSRKLTL